MPTADSNYSWDLDGDGIDDVRFESSYSGIAAGLDTFYAHYNYGLGELDNTILLYFTGEAYNANGPHYKVWNSTTGSNTMYMANFVNGIQQTTKATLNIVLQFSYSGSFVNSLHGDDRVVMSSTNATVGFVYDYIWTISASERYSWFTYYWISILKGYDQYALEVIYADSNYDAYITMREVYWFMWNNPLTINCGVIAPYPQYWSSSDPDVGSIQTLCGKVKYDLFTRDDTNDCGNQPYLTANNCDSPDIWNRNNQDGVQTHQPIVKQGINYFYVKVRNRGSFVSNTDSIQIYLQPMSTNLSRFRRLLATAPIPQLHPNSEIIVCVPAYVPNMYSGNGFSIITEIKSSRDITLRNTNSLYDYVAGSNNISLKNTALFYYCTNENGVSIPTASFRSSANNYGTTPNSLNFGIKTNANDLKLNDVAEVYITINRSFMEMWPEDDRTMSGLEQINDSIFLVTSDNVVIHGFVPPADEDTLSGVKVEIFYRAEHAEYEDNFEICAKQYSGDFLIGGLTLEASKKSRLPFNANAGNDTCVLAGDCAMLTATAIGEPAVYNWYNQAGALVDTGRTIVVSATANTAYTLEVISKTDGYKAYDNVNICVVHGKINSVSPNPAPASTATLAVNCQLENYYSYKLAIFTQSGIEISATDVQKNTELLDISSLHAGVYTIALICDGSTIDSKTIIKQ